MSGMSVLGVALVALLMVSSASVVEGSEKPLAGEEFKYAIVGTYEDAPQVYQEWEETMATYHDNEYERAKVRMHITSMASTSDTWNVIHPTGGSVRLAYLLKEKFITQEDHQIVILLKKKPLFSSEAEGHALHSIDLNDLMTNPLPNMVGDIDPDVYSPIETLDRDSSKPRDSNKPDSARDCFADPAGVLGLDAERSASTISFLKDVGRRVKNLAYVECYRSPQIGKLLKKEMDEYPTAANLPNTPKALPCYTIGVVGGMGPLAGANFVHMVAQRVMSYSDRLDASVEYNLISLINGVCLNMYSNPKFPTTFSVAASSPMMGPKFYTGLKKFMSLKNINEFAGPCNTFHQNMYKSFTKEWSGGRQTNIIGEVAKKLTQDMGLKSVGILATTATMKDCDKTANSKSMYAEYFEQYNIINRSQTDKLLLRRPPSDRAHVGIWAAKKGHMAEAKKILLEEAAALYKEYNVDAIIGGCTEVALALDESDLRAIGIKHFYDSAEILADSVSRQSIEWVLKQGSERLSSMDRRTHGDDVNAFPSDECTNECPLDVQKRWATLVRQTPGIQTPPLSPSQNVNLFTPPPPHEEDMLGLDRWGDRQFSSSDITHDEPETSSIVDEQAPELIHILGTPEAPKDTLKVPQDHRRFRDVPQ